MKIGELAIAGRCDIQTVRYYERSGLLPAPDRTSSNYRAFGPGHLERLQFIRRCRSLDMSLGEVRVLLGFVDAPDRDCGEVNRLLDERLGQVEARIEQLRLLGLQLRRLRGQCRKVRAARDCGILAELGLGGRSAGRSPGGVGRRGAVKAARASPSSPGSRTPGSR